MTQTVLLVHVNIYLKRTVHLRVAYCVSAASPRLSSASYSVFKFREILFRQQFDWSPSGKFLVDSDWILRTLSPSNESSKDLNLQESIYMIQFAKSSVIRCWFADITTLFLQTTVIPMVISITYQSAGHSLAKLGVAHRSHDIHHMWYQLPRACTTHPRI